MSVRISIGCLLNMHEPVRRHVAWNGRAYVGQCRHCAAPIERHGRRKWRRRAAGEEGTPEPSSG